jgi:flagellar hook-associated protein 3 FlgL
MNSQLLDAALKTQAKTAEMQIQQASGLVSTDYGGLGRTAREVINLEISVTRARSYVDTAQSAGNQIEIMYSSCGSMVDLLTTIRSQLTGTTSSSENSVATLKSSASEILEEFSALLNTQYEGRYLFSGSRTDTPAVDTAEASYPVQTAPSTSDTSYYLGNADAATARTSSDQLIQYGVTADNPAFEKALRALNLLRGLSTDPIDTDSITEAQALIVDGLDGVLAIQTGLSLDAAAMERAASTQQDYVDYVSSQVSNLRDVDIAAVAAQLSAYETQLQASYSAIGRLQNMSILNYL